VKVLRREKNDKQAQKVTSCIVNDCEDTPIRKLDEFINAAQVVSSLGTAADNMTITTTNRSVCNRHYITEQSRGMSRVQCAVADCQQKSPTESRQTWCSHNTLCKRTAHKFQKTMWCAHLVTQHCSGRLQTLTSQRSVQTTTSRA